MITNEEREALETLGREIAERKEHLTASVNKETGVVELRNDEGVLRGSMSREAWAEISSIRDQTRTARRFRSRGTDLEMARRGNRHQRRAAAAFDRRRK